MGISVGIDLGTSNSVVATVWDGQAVVLADALEDDGTKADAPSTATNRAVDAAKTLVMLQQFVGVCCWVNMLGLL